MSPAGTTGPHVEVGTLIAWPFMDPSCLSVLILSPVILGVGGYPTVMQLEEESLP